MPLEFLSQQPQPLHAAAESTAKGGGHSHLIATLSLSLSLSLEHKITISPPPGRVPFNDKGGEELSRPWKEETMSRRNGATLDLKLNLSPPRAPVDMPGRRSLSVSPTSSCVSSELNQDEHLRYSTSPEATSSMMLVGCPRCLMYVMLAEEDPKCPKCKSSVLLDIIHEHNNLDTTITRNAKKS